MAGVCNGLGGEFYINPSITCQPVCGSVSERFHKDVHAPGYVRVSIRSDVSKKLKSNPGVIGPRRAGGSFWSIPPARYAEEMVHGKDLYSEPVGLVGRSQCARVRNQGGGFEKCSCPQASFFNPSMVVPRPSLASTHTHTWDVSTHRRE